MVAIKVQGVVPAWTTADRLRKARETAGYEQQALALELGVAKNTISNYERGAVTPRRPVLVAWAMATGVPLEWLEDDEGPRHDDEGPAVRPKGLEPPTFWTVLRRALTRRRAFRADYALCA